MTRVAFQVDQLFHRPPGGIGTYVRRLVPSLVQEAPGLDLKLFHARFEKAGPPERWMRELWVEELPRGIRSLYPRWNLTARPPLPRSLSSLDVLHAPSPVAVPPAGSGQRLVVTVHDLAFLFLPRHFPAVWRQMFRLGLRAAVRRADAIITPSRSTAADLLSRTAVEPARVHVVPLAASAPPTPLAVGGPGDTTGRLGVEPPYLLFVGTLEPRKNLIRLVRSYRRAAARGVAHALVLAGPLGWRHERLLREIALPGPGRIVQTGPLTAEDLEALYRNASAFVYPALYEGFGLPVLDAMQRGVPVVSSKSSSLPELTEDAALSVNPWSVRDLEGAIETVLTDAAVAARLAAAGKARAARFSWQETARMTVQVYEKARG